MSLYSKLFGENVDTPILLGMIGVNKQYFERFRDVFLCNNGKNIKIYTRIGGDNRSDYEATWKKIKQHILYKTDYDDSFDNTYAYIEFSIPEKYEKVAQKMYKNEPISVGDMFKKECEEMKQEGSEAYKRAEKIANMIIKEIENPKNGGIIRL